MRLRCNYCHRDPRTILRWASRVQSRGRWRALTITAAACAEHEDCVSFRSVRELHPDARVEIREGGRP